MIDNLYTTNGVMQAMLTDGEFSKQVGKCIERFSQRDWGDLCEDDKRMNDNANILKDRIVAKYETKLDPIYIITEWDKSATTVLFTKEY